WQELGSATPLLWLGGAGRWEWRRPLRAAWGPNLLGGAVRGGERAGDCPRPRIGGASVVELANFGCSAGGLGPARVLASRPPAPAADRDAKLVGSGRAQGPPPLPPARPAVPQPHQRPYSPPTFFL